MFRITEARGVTNRTEQVGRDAAASMANILDERGLVVFVRCSNLPATRSAFLQISQDLRSQMNILSVEVVFFVVQLSMFSTTGLQHRALHGAEAHASEQLAEGEATRNLCSRYRNDPQSRLASLNHTANLLGSLSALSTPILQLLPES